MDSNNRMSCIFCSALLMFFFTSKTLLCSVVANNTISSGQSLSGNQTIVSQNGNFELGFFTPGKSLKYYLGIWYTEASAENRMVVWVANRDHPLNDLPSSELKLFDNGNLVLLNDLKMPIWSTNSTSKAFKSSTAVLGDDGNLVLRDGSSIILWQSFDHPTNTLLAGAKLGYDKRAKMAAQKLTSWRNSEDPAHGIYSVQSEGPDGNFEVRWNGSAAYWSTDAWSTDSFYSTIKLRSILNSFNFSFISNENESYFTFSPKDKSVLDFVMLDFNGQLKSYFLVKETQSWNLIWYQPTLQCQAYGFCGDFGVCRENSLPVCQCLPGFKQHHPKDWDLLDYSGGCVRETSLQCGGKDWFLKLHNVRLPVNSKASRVEKADNCKLACSNNCSCSAYAYTSAGCLTWHGNLLNIQQLDSDGDDLYLRMAASEVSSSGRKVSVLPIAIGVVAGMTALAVISVLVVFSRLGRMKRKVNTSVTEEDNSPGPMHHYTFLTAFEYKQLKVATKNFSDKLGSGGFGSVLKGVLPDSTPIAVKKLEGISQGEKQFRSEVSTLGLVQHVNLVRLLGFCSEGNNRMLVYHFMSNGSLDSHLFSQDDSKVLNWSTRYQIAVGIGRGLAYLHEQCRDCIIHCDIKPENILLDADFTPKVADFGLAKIVGHEFSRVLTTFRGTVGYLAPEWTTGVAITTKADVYSYGMMLFEIISGRRNMKQHVNGKMCFFPTWAANKVLSKGHQVLCILDEKLECIADVEELTRAFSVACWCIQEEEIQRPSMGQIVQILEGLLEVNSPPIPKYLEALLENEEPIISFFSE